MFNRPSVENYLHIVDEKPKEQVVLVTVDDLLVLGWYGAHSAWVVRNCCRACRHVAILLPRQLPSICEKNRQVSTHNSTIPSEIQIFF